MKFRKMALASLLLSLGFFLWWFIWPLLSFAGPLAQLWRGLPLWFWLSSIASLPLLWMLSLLFLPNEQPEEKPKRATG